MSAGKVALPSDHARDFERLVAEHRGEVLRVCRSILRDEHLGADAAQETFLALWKACAAGNPLERTGAFLRRVAVNTSLDHARRRRARAAEALEPEPRATGHTSSSSARTSGTELASPAAEPSANAWRTELRARLERALPALSEGQRTVFLLRHEGCLSLAEVAAALGVELSTVKTQFARACLKLQAHLAPFRPEERP